MAVATPPEVNTPEWWLERLSARLQTRKRVIKRYDDYFSGRHNLYFSTPKFRSKFGTLLEGLKDNWTQIVVEAALERMRVNGFRWGDDPLGDEEAWRIWQTNRMDAESSVLLREMLINGVAYVLVDPFVQDRGAIPDITVEHPEQVIVAMEPGSRWKRAAALKMWEDDWGETLATLYLPNGIYKFKKVHDSSSSRVILPQGTRFSDWAPREVDSEAWPLPNPVGVVPMVPFENKARMLKEGESEIENVIPNQDAVNKFLADMLIASEAAAFRQRYVTGWDDGDEDSDEVDPPRFDSDAASLWWTASEKAKFGEFAATELANYVKAIENRVQSIASQSRTPPHYFYLTGQFPSGESIKSAETGLVSKVRDKLGFTGESFEDVIRLVFRIKGDSKGDDMSSETIWGDPESRTESEAVDGAVKLKALGIADEVLQERIGLTPKQIRRNRSMIEAQRLEERVRAIEDQALASAQPPAPGPVPQPEPRLV